MSKHKHVKKIAVGDVVVPIHAWEQASNAVINEAATLCIDKRYHVEKVRDVYNGLLVTLKEMPKDEFSASLFTQPPEIAFAPPYHAH